MFDLIPLILAFSLREKGLADSLKCFATTLAALESNESAGVFQNPGATPSPVAVVLATNREEEET